MKVLEHEILKLHPFFQVRFGSPPSIYFPLERKRLTVVDPVVVQAIALITGEMRRDHISAALLQNTNLSRETAVALVQNLIDNGILVSRTYELEQLEGVRHWSDRNWLQALLLHLETRSVPYRDDAFADRPQELRETLHGLVESEGVPNFWEDYGSMPVIDLPAPEALPSGASLIEVLHRRTSFSPWLKQPVNIHELSAILRSANAEGLSLRLAAEATVHERPGVLMNSSYSALETDIVAFRVKGLAPGVYRYSMKDHTLRELRRGDYQDQVVNICIGQRRPRGASCVMFISAVWERYMYRYRHSRAYLNLLTNVAELAQKYIIAATALHYSNFLTPALRDELAGDLLSSNIYERAPLYAVAIG